MRGTWSAEPGDDQARFLADLRSLRDSAAIGYDELSARAHYPSDVLKEAENGPVLPGLPILSAYVRACEGDVLDWEERWRRLNPEVADDPDLPVRPAGASAAAVAGARAGVGVAPPDVYDPDRIRAALRGDQGRAGPPSRRDDDPGVLAPAAADAHPGYDQPVEPDPGQSWGAGRGWDATPEPDVTAANGHHLAQQAARGPFDAAYTSPPETAASPADGFSWRQASPPQSSPAENEPTSWSSPASQERSSWPPVPGNAPSSWSAHADSGPAPLPEPGSLASEPDNTERIPRYQTESLAAPERTDFWAPPASSAPSPAAPSPAAPLAAGSPSAAAGDPGARTEEAAVTRASRPSASEPPAPPVAAPAGTAASGAVTSGAGTTQPLSTPGAAAQPSRAGRTDRYFPVRLLVVIIIAALIGSALVLLLK